MGIIELTVGREDYGGYDAEPGRLGEFWQKARPREPVVSTMYHISHVFLDSCHVYCAL